MNEVNASPEISTVPITNATATQNEDGSKFQSDLNNSTVRRTVVSISMLQIVSVRHLHRSETIPGFAATLTEIEKIIDEILKMAETSFKEEDFENEEIQSTLSELSSNGQKHAKLSFQFISIIEVLLTQETSSENTSDITKKLDELHEKVLALTKTLVNAPNLDADSLSNELGFSNFNSNLNDPRLIAAQLIGGFQNSLRNLTTQLTTDITDDTDLTNAASFIGGQNLPGLGLDADPTVSIDGEDGLRLLDAI